MPGRFISFEGGEGCGKTTQVARLAARLRTTGADVVTTREPGGTPGAEAIRTLLVTGATDRWDALSELYLLNAARRDHVRHVIAPALARGAVVLCDRFVDSTRVYQGHVKGLPDADIRTLHEQATDGLWPDLTLLLDLPPDAGLDRAAARRDSESRFEGEGTAFHQRLRAGFLALAQAEPARIRVVDATGTPDEVAARIWAIVL